MLCSKEINMRLLKLLPLIVFMLTVTYAADTSAATIFATTCDQQDVQTAINSAGHGDTVIIPDGSATWSSSITVNKSVTLKGGGIYSVDAEHEDNGTWPLTINCNYSTDSAIVINGPSGGAVRVSGISFTGTVPRGTSGGGVFQIEATNESSYRIDNCKFSLSSGNILTSNCSGRGEGLVDHIHAVVNACNEDNGIVAKDARVDSYGDWAFTQAVGFGTGNFLFVEDSTFLKTCTNGMASTYCMDAQAGGRYVFRHNYVRDQMITWHGTSTGAPERGGYVFEIYNNEFYWSLGTYWKYHTAIFSRGGTCIIYNNTASYYHSLWKTWVRRTEGSFGRFGKADGTKAWDGNWGSPYPTAYPLLDQPGRGAASSATLAEVQPQEESKCRIWNNTLVSVSDPVYHNNPDWVVKGRDYEISADESARPSSYTPFPYPHPLQSSGDSSNPTPPSKLRIVE
jgi:hypothetical protein